MSTPPFDLSSGDFALHSPWMRRLARGLVGDAATADDVVQDAWTRLAGDQRRPGYLAAVVRSLALRRHRSERRRERRERRAARAEALPSAAKVAERAEVARRLAQAVERLDEPYRTTIVLRYYEDLSSAEIARRARIPAATVRARLKRGLDVLRARLDDQGGGRARWVGALLPLTRSETQASSALSASLTTLLSVKLALAAVLLLGGLAVVWAVVSVGGAPQAPPVTLAAEEPERSESAPSPTAPAVIDGSARAAALVELPEAPATAAPAAPPQPGRVRARALDPDGEPLRNAWLRLRRAPEHTAQGNADGVVELEVAPAELARLAGFSNRRTLEVEVGAPGHQLRHLRHDLPEGADELELGEVQLERGGSVRGRVVDASGLGVEGALVVAGMPVDLARGESAATRRGPRDLDLGSWSTHDLALKGRSGPGGAFHLDGVAVGYATVWARTAKSLWTFSEPVGVRAGEDVFGVELVVHDAPESVIAGRVLDPDGRPLVGLQLTFTRSNAEASWSDVRTDARGAFWFAPAEGAAQDITARSPSWEWEDEVRMEVASGTLDLVIAFERSEWLWVTAVDPEGARVRNGRAVGLPGSGSTDFPLPRCEAELDHEGRARLRRPMEPLRIRVEAPGYRDRIVGPFDPALFPAPLHVALEPLPALLGQVLHPDGRPASHARVSLHRGAAGAGGVTPPGGAGETPNHLSHQGWAGEGDAFVYELMVEAAAEVTADEHGRYRLPLPGVDPASPDEVAAEQGRFSGLGYAGGTRAIARAKPGQAWYVHAAAGDAATVTSGPHVFEPTHDAELDLELPRGGSIAGRLVLGGGASPAGWTVRASDALARIAEAPVSADGSFAFGDLHPGGWQVRAFAPGARYWPGRMRTSRTPEPDVEVVAGRTVEYEHVAGTRESARLHGRLWADGAPAGPWHVVVRTVTPQSSIDSHEMTLDPDGRFEVRLEPGLRTLIEAFRRSAADELSLSSQPTIVAGDNEWSFDLETARLEGTLDASRATGWANARPSYESEQGGVTIRATLRLDEEGCFGPVLVPAGLGVLRGPRENFREPGPIWAELDLEPGETRTIDL